MKLKNNVFLSGAVYLALGSFFSKLLGTVYRIPLTNLIGGEGLGLYQMVFPIYCLLLDFSGAGFPNALSKMIASSDYLENEKRTKKLLIDSIKLSLVSGLFGFILMLVFAKSVASLQGNKDAYLGYVFLSPAILFVSLLSCFRGYFQGKMNMLPTAISQVIEQATKLILGLAFASIFMPNIPLAVGGATLAVSISEIVAFLYLFLTYKIKNKGEKLRTLQKDQDISFKKNSLLIIKTAVPITLLGLIFPISHVADSFIIINVLNGYRSDSTALFGLFSGSATTVINLPVAICYGIATSVIPLLSSEKDEIKQEKSADRARNLTLLLSVPCTILCLIFAPLIVRILFTSLTVKEKEITINLIRIMSVNITLLSFLQTQNAVLTGKGRTYLAIIGLSVGVVVKIILSIILLQIEKLNIYGASIAVFACYFTACLVNFILDKVKVNRYEGKKSCNRQLAN